MKKKKSDKNNIISNTCAFPVMICQSVCREKRLMHYCIVYCCWNIFKIHQFEYLRGEKTNKQQLWFPDGLNCWKSCCRWSKGWENTTGLLQINKLPMSWKLSNWLRNICSVHDKGTSPNGSWQFWHALVCITTSVLINKHGQLGTSLCLEN